MSKLSFFFTTLIAAIPAAFLAYLCVAAFLFHSDALSGGLMAVTGLTLLLSVVIVALPAAVLLRKEGSKPAKVKEAAPAAPAGSDESGWDESSGGAHEDLGEEIAGDADPFAEGVDDLEAFEEETPKRAKKKNR